MAKQAIRDNYTISTNKVTSAMIRKAQDIIVNLLNEDKLERFNKLLISLFMTIPRKMGKVSDHLATNKNDFAKIVQREQDLLDVMNGQVVQHQTEENNNRVVHHNETILDVLQIDLAPATFEDIEKIKYALGTCKKNFTMHGRQRMLKRRMPLTDILVIITFMIQNYFGMEAETKTGEA